MKFNLDDVEKADFTETREDIDKILDSLDSFDNPHLQSAICGMVVRHYKHLAQLDGIRDNAKEEAKYFLQKLNQYETKCQKQV